jgi:phage tail-like protein
VVGPSFPPPAAFHFAIAFDLNVIDSSFQEISGLKAEWGTEDVQEGGQNRFVHRLPTRTKFSNLVLKRGVVRLTSPLAYWLSDCFSGDFIGNPVVPKLVNVLLLDGRHRPVVHWQVEGAYPLAWEHSTLNSMENSLLVETVELSYRYFERHTFAYPDEVFGS